MAWALNWSDWFDLMWLFASLSLLTVGAGAMMTAPQMYQYLVVQKAWLSASAFSASIAIAQTTPGPNATFVPLFGWQVGIEQGPWTWAMIAMLTALIASLLPSSIVTIYGARWVRRNQNWSWVKAFKIALAPVSAGLLATTGWFILLPKDGEPIQWHLWVMAAVTTLMVWKTSLNLLWFLSAGAVVGVVMSL